MKKIISITFAVIMLCLTLGIAGCGHSSADCPICTKTVDSEYTDLLSFYKVINPGATDELAEKGNDDTDFVPFDAIGELKNRVMNIKGLLFPEIPSYITESYTQTFFYDLINSEGETYGYRVYYRQESESTPGIVSYNFYCGTNRMFSDNEFRGAPPYEKWTDEFFGYETTIEYSTKAHFSNDPHYESVFDYIHFGFTHEGIFYMLEIAIIGDK